MTTSSKDFIVDLIYNNQAYSDVILEIGANKFYLHLPVIKQHAPALFEEFEKIPNVSLTTSPDAQLDQMLANLTTMLIKPKKTLKITDLTVTKETLDAVLKFMYTSTLEVTTANYMEIYTVSIRFGMKELSEKCTEILRQSLKIDTLLEDSKNAFIMFSPLTKVYLDVLKNNLSVLPKDKLLEFVPILMYETMLEIVSEDSNCTEDLMYDMVDAWYQHNKNLEQAKVLMSKVNLHALSSHFLLTKLKTSPLVDSNMYLSTLEWREYERRQDPHLRTKYVFAIGKIDGTYPGYRLMTHDDVSKSSFQSLFKEHYDKNNGVYCVDGFPADVLCCKDYKLTVKTPNGHWLRISKKNATTYGFVKLNTSCSDITSTQTVINTISVGDKININSIDYDANSTRVDCNAGLFIRATMLLM